MPSKIRTSTPADFALGNYFRTPTNRLTTRSTNVARFYNDHAHPEYSTPECTTLQQIAAQDKAGERILAECARRRNLKLPSGYEVRLYKNNTDFAGHSYGCHDNYLMTRDIPW